jgi:predicted enzyme related to lactoylglutathione lyase
MLHVADLARSMAFYAQLGFEVGDTFTPNDSAGPAWAWLSTNDAQIMLTKASAPVDPEAQAVIYYIYCDDVAAMHAHLTGHGHRPGRIQTPFYSPGGEFRIRDPDGYDLTITHFGEPSSSEPSQ